jgi:hypothetical protein
MAKDVSRKQQKIERLEKIESWIIRHEERPKTLAGLRNAIAPVLIFKTTICPATVMKTLQTLGVITFQKKKVVARTITQAHAQEILQKYDTPVEKQLANKIMTWIRRSIDGKCVPKQHSAFERSLEPLCTAKGNMDPDIAVKHLKENQFVVVNPSGQCVYFPCAATSAMAAPATANKAALDAATLVPDLPSLLALAADAYMHM